MSNKIGDKVATIISVIFTIGIVAGAVALISLTSKKTESDCTKDEIWNSSLQKCESKYNNVKDLENEIALEKKEQEEIERGRRNGTICIPASETQKYVGVNGCVSMYVQHVYYKSGTAFLNSEGKKGDFSVAAFKNVLTRNDVDYYLGKKIEVYGEIVLYEGEAEIIINSKSNIIVK